MIDLHEHEELMRRIREEIVDGLDEEMELEIEDHDSEATGDAAERHRERVRYFRELFRLQGELVKL
ncbi:MAG: polyphosphate kinase 2, partial [Betaproteobacteria bacterium]|nr:polyphosphate kinase 2 [Betaproteobacteria bacterium]